MKKLTIAFLLPFALLCSQALHSQSGKDFGCSNGKVHFLASTAIEDIEATSNSRQHAFLI